MTAPPSQILRPPTASNSFKTQAGFGSSGCPPPCTDPVALGAAPSTTAFREEAKFFPHPELPAAPGSSLCSSLLFLFRPPPQLCSSLLLSLFQPPPPSLPGPACCLPQAGHPPAPEPHLRSPLPASPREAPRPPHHASHPHTHSPWSGGLSTLSQRACPIPSRPRVAGEGLTRCQCR